MLPLHIAAEKNRADIMRLLVALGADLTKTDLNLRNSVHCAAENGSSDVLAVRSLLLSFFTFNMTEVVLSIYNEALQ